MGVLTLFQLNKNCASDIDFSRKLQAARIFYLILNWASDDVS